MQNFDRAPDAGPQADWPQFLPHPSPPATIYLRHYWLQGDYCRPCPIECTKKNDCPIEKVAFGVINVSRPAGNQVGQIAAAKNGTLLAESAVC
ncbi:MAG: hypothetical protein Q8S20_16195 [Sulfuritalea sp.]|nr:hypothetical protein [Sulfuritalea sp.]